MISVAESTRAWAAQRQVPCVFTEVTGSTNDDVKRASRTDPSAEWLALTAHQTKGRGRTTNAWLDTGVGDSLLATWCFEMASPPQAITAPRIGLCLYEAVTRAWPSLEFGLKAPNDLYLGGRKVAGLLVEVVSDGAGHRLVVGLGLNVLNHPRNLGVAIHLGEALGRPVDEAEWFTFLDEWARTLRAVTGEITAPELTAAAREHLRRALNANVARPFTITEVTAAGDLVHDGGRVSWLSL